MLKLRPNQTDAVRIATEFFKQENAEPGLMVLPTAWGKSILSVDWALDKYAWHDTAKNKYLLQALRSERQRRINTGWKEPLPTIMPVGKHKDRRIDDVPKDYLKWMADNFSWTPKFENLRKAINLALAQ